MLEILTFLAMIFCHIIDDFKIQPPLLNLMKQKSWWEENYPEKMYKNDYKIALFLHSFSWSFMIHIPLVIYAYLNNFLFKDGFTYVFLFLFIAEISIHYFVDNMKANNKLINLSQDQKAHIFQLLLLWIIYICLNYGGA